MYKSLFPILSASAALAVMASLAACGSGETPDNAAQPGAELAQQNTAIPVPLSESDAPAPPPGDADAAGGQDGGSGEGAALPPPGAFRFVGLWAAKAEMCGDQAWKFTREGLETPAKSVCKFVNAVPVAGGYDISARCTSEGPPVDDELKIRFAESAQAMLFEAESIADAGLIYCGAAEE
jgi:hypothetical protein